MSLDCTRYHKFVLSDDTRVKAEDLSIGSRLKKWTYPVINSITQENMVHHDAYTNGFYSGDGTKNRNEIVLYAEKQKLIPFLNVERSLEYEGKTKVILKEQPVGKDYVPGVEKDVSYRLDWLAGLIDSDGCANDIGGSIAISSINRDFMRRVQLLLSTLGCHSYVNDMHLEADRMLPANDGSGSHKLYHCQDCFRLTISAWNVRKLLDLGLRLHRVDVDPQPNRGASRFITVTKIEEIPDEETVYCFEEPINHTGVFNGIMTAQCSEFYGNSGNSCNLSSINLYNVVTHPFTKDILS